MDTKIKKIQRERRKKRIRARAFGTEERPRLSVFRSNKYISAQLINDDNGRTLVATSTRGIKKGTLIEKAKVAGSQLAKDALAKNIKLAVFDRSGYLYTGSVAALASGAREGGLKF